MRVEDLDGPRVVPGAEARIAEDLRWLGLDWDEGPDEGGGYGPYRQSERRAFYEDALATLSARGLTYLCDCSRAEIARVASAPHEGEELRYPGTCRPLGMKPRDFRRPPAIRFAVPERPERTLVRFRDGVRGDVEEDVQRAAGDFVLRRGDGVFAYQLAVVVDDLAMRIDHVVRGADLLASTGRQITLARALGAEPPGYLHTPLVVGPTGERLAKRARGVPVADQRAAGRSAPDVIGALAHALGLVGDDRACSPRDLLRATTGPIRLGPVTVPARLLGDLQSA